MIELYIGNDNEVVIDGLSLASDGTYVNDATLLVTVYDAAGNAVSGWSAVSVAYVAASNGDYRGVLPGTASLTEGASYRLVVTSSNYNLRWETWGRAVRRAE